MGRPEASVERYLRDRVRDEGGVIRKVQWAGVVGAPDRLLWLPSTRLTYAWVECKRPGEKVNWRSPQGREIGGMRAAGWLVYVVNSREQVDQMLEDLKKGVATSGSMCYKGAVSNEE